MCARRRPSTTGLHGLGAAPPALARMALDHTHTGALPGLRAHHGELHVRYGRGKDMDNWFVCQVVSSTSHFAFGGTASLDGVEGRRSRKGDTQPENLICPETYALRDFLKMAKSTCQHRTKVAMTPATGAAMMRADIMPIELFISSGFDRGLIPGGIIVGGKFLDSRIIGATRGRRSARSSATGSSRYRSGS